MIADLEGGEWSAANPPVKDPVPILQETGWAPRPVWTGGKSRPHWDSIPDRSARSQLLYRLSYPAHLIIIIIIIIIIITTTFMNKKTKNIFLIDTAVPNTHSLAKK
jgi:hypothetical protein